MHYKSAEEISDKPCCTDLVLDAETATRTPPSKAKWFHPKRALLQALSAKMVRLARKLLFHPRLNRCTGLVGAAKRFADFC
jgi:hypothetical protein